MGVEVSVASGIVSYSQIRSKVWEVWTYFLCGRECMEMKCVPVSVKNVPVSGLLRVCLALSEGVHGECACEWKYAYT